MTDTTWTGLGEALARFEVDQGVTVSHQCWGPRKNGRYVDGKLLWVRWDKAAPQGKKVPFEYGVHFAEVDLATLALSAWGGYYAVVNSFDTPVEAFERAMAEYRNRSA